MPIDPLAERVAKRFTAAVTLDPKMQALLLKLRKGADSSLSLGQLIKVLALLGGWRVEEIVALAQLHYDQHPYHLRIENDEAKAKAVYDHLKSLEVTTLPSSPKLGQFYVMDLEPFKLWGSQWDNLPNHGTEYRLWAGVPGVRFTDPEGKVFELAPDRHVILGGMSGLEQDKGLPTIDPKALKKRTTIYKLMAWLKEKTTWMAQINQVLGMGEHVPAAQRTRDNTGTCGACFRNIKLVQRGEKTVMALHGYNRPGDGYIIGECWGGNHSPYELSDEATKRVLEAAKHRMEGAEAYVKELTDPNLAEFNANHGVFGAPPIIVKREDAQWEMKLSHQQRSADRDLHDAKHKHGLYKWLVENWKIRDLPKEGDKEVDWYMLAAKASHSG